jgi:hypothetical protein
LVVSLIGSRAGRCAREVARPRERTGCVARGGGGVLPVSLVQGCGWCAGLEDGPECGALGVGQGWCLGDEVLNVCGEGVGDGAWRRGW